MASGAGKGCRPSLVAALSKITPDDLTGMGGSGTGSEGGSKKAAVIAMMKRAKGVTLSDIMAITGWQAHTVRGMVSILGSKGGVHIESSKNASGERTYRVTK